jgi:tetratricopeptide (TPR) repeat protein/tRNA A-37 threonylcarbamoyl transferase component Bud32
VNADRNQPGQPGPANGPTVLLPAEPYRAPGDGPGASIGPYKLLQQIGEGGFGIVYMAEQDQPVHRRVALKIIKPGMDSAQVIARFEAERQALAMMEHQNIAKVFDAGTTGTGRPYFVMELVHGVPVTKYCDDNHLTIQERLALFVSICKATQHAHQKGIIHRDLKPTNVLVCLYDGQPVPKVIDFGVAKAMEQRLTERTMFTQYGQIVGTFEYMSPEQAEMSQLGLDTRSDIYSLGVMLYELLTGSTPLQWLGQAGLSEVLKMIKEEEPPRPSARLSSTQEGATLAAARRTEPVKLARLLRGELDWVVMKCLEKDRARRYDSAIGLARDIERYLNDEPVEAGPPGAGYRLRKLARKHRTALGVAGMFVALLVLATGLSTWQAVRATRAERQALAERDRAEASFRMARDTVDRFFTHVADSPKLKSEGMEKFRKDLLANAKEFYERFIGEQLDAPEVRHELGLAHIRLARIHEVLGDYAAAQALSNKAIEALGESARAHPEADKYQRDLAAGHFQMGAVYSDTGNLDQAEAAYRQTLAIQEKLAGDHPEVAEYRRAVATTLNALGIAEHRANQYEKAQATLERALTIWGRLVENDARVPEDRDGLANAQVRLGDVYADRGQSEKAEAMLKEAVSTYRALVRDYPEVPDHRRSLADTYDVLGGLYSNNMRQVEKAEAALQQALPIFEKLAKEHPDVLEFSYCVGRCYSNLALVERDLGRPDAALTRFDKAIAILEHVAGRGHGEARMVLVDTRIKRLLVLVGRGEHVRATHEANAVARQERLIAANLYNVTCVFSLSSAAAEKDTKLSPEDRTKLQAQYVDRAMDFLHQAVAEGFQDAPSLKNDPDLSPLRSRLDFRKLVQEVEQKGKK